MARNRQRRFTNTIKIKLGVSNWGGFIKSHLFLELCKLNFRSNSGYKSRFLRIRYDQ